MRDWAIDYILHVLEAKDWSANELASRSGVAASTISRPLRTRDYSGSLSRRTIKRIHDASGIDPAPFIPNGMSEPRAEYAAKPLKSQTRRTLEALIDRETGNAPERAENQIQIAVVGSHAQIVATVDLKGIAKLRKKLDAIEQMLDPE